MILNALVEKLKRRSKDDFKGRHYEATLILQAILVPALSAELSRHRGAVAGARPDRPLHIGSTSRFGASGAICTEPSTSTARQSTSCSRRSAIYRPVREPRQRLLDLTQARIDLVG